MDKLKLFREINNFYQIRGDNFARDYVLRFVDLIIEHNVELEDLGKWYKVNKNKIKYDFPVGAKPKYERVLNQFIKYVGVVFEVKLFRNSFPKHPPRRTKIHNTYHDFQKNQ